jgi:hypothetical protein
MDSKIVLFIFIAMITSACGQSTSDHAENQDCKYGTPEALFGAEQPGVSAHSFTAKATEATERVTFSNGIRLTLLQSGCNHIRQEFRFELSEVPEDAGQQFWIMRTVELLRMLSSAGPNYAAFATWADEIEQRRENIKLAESFAIQQGFYVRIDRIRSGDNATLVLTLSDQP